MHISKRKAEWSKQAEEQNVHTKRTKAGRAREAEAEVATVEAAEPGQEAVVGKEATSSVGDAV